MKHMSKFRIEYFDKLLECNSVEYFNGYTYGDAIASFRELFDRKNYVIVEVSRVYDYDWSKY